MKPLITKNTSTPAAPNESQLVVGLRSVMDDNHCCRGETEDLDAVDFRLHRPQDGILTLDVINISD